MDRRLRDGLDEPFSPGDLERLWGRVEQRLPAPQAPALSWRPALGIAAAAAALTLTLGGADLWRQHAQAPSALVQPPGPLTRAGQAEALPPSLAGELRLQLSDRSELRSEGATELQVLENSGSHFGLKQARGRVHYEVTPGGPRRWTIDCSLATIEVVGTAFWVDSNPGQVRVQVERGAVLVRGERVPERVQRLGPGETLTIQAPAAPTPSSSVLATTAPTPSAPAAAPSGSAAVARGVWRELARKGAFRDAYEQLGSGGIDAASREASVEELFALADVARYSGHPREALAPLGRVAQRGGPQGALAAFTLGRIRMDQLGEHAAAAQDFERALALGLGGGLQEDAAVRRVEALGKAGDRSRAAALARELVDRTPSLQGRLAPWLSE